MASKDSGGLWLFNDMELRQKARLYLLLITFLQMLFSFLPNACPYLHDWKMYMHCYLFERTQEAPSKISILQIMQLSF
jgi:hypothetical protein